MGGLKTIKTLKLNKNRLTVVPDFLEKWQTLNLVIDLSGNIIKEIPEWISRTNIFELNLSFNLI